MVRTSAIAVVTLAAVASAKIVPGCVENDGKAMGATGQPRVDWSEDGCCDDNASLQSKSAPDWGLFCTIGGNQSAADKAAEDKLTKALEKDDPVPEEEDDAPTVAATDANKDKESEDNGTAKPVVAGAAPAAATTTTGDNKDDEATKESPEDDAATAAGTTKKDDPSDEDDAEESVEDDDEGSVCFPAKATVELETGETKAMEDVSVGDMVKVGVNEFSRVFMFTHKLADAENTFLSIKTAETSLTLTPGHYLYVNGALAAAKTVAPGDSLTLGSGAVATVTSVAPVQATGLFNPQTVSGNVVVDNVLASTYTTAVEPTFAHAILAPFRALQSFVTLTALESGGGALADVAPRGQALF